MGLTLLLPLQVLERDGWAGLEEVTRLLNGHEFAAAGETTCGRICIWNVYSVSTESSSRFTVAGSDHVQILLSPFLLCNIHKLVMQPGDVISMFAGKKIRFLDYSRL